MAHTRLRTFVAALAVAGTAGTLVASAPAGAAPTQERRLVDVEVRGGRATAAIYCFNVTDGGGRVVQINVCSAALTGGLLPNLSLGI